MREAENECSLEQGSILRGYKRQVSGTVDAINEEPDSIEEEEKKILKPRNLSNATEDEPINNRANLSGSSSDEKPKSKD